MHKYVLARRVTTAIMGIGALFILTYGLGQVFASTSPETQIGTKLAEVLLGIGLLLLVLGLLMRAGLWMKGSPPGSS